MEFSVPEAAERLGISRRRVRALAESGDLVARRVGRMWLIDESALRSPTRSQARAGRPLSARSAWAVLHLLGGDEAPGLSRSELHRARERARTAHLAPPGWLSSRARVHALVTHPGSLGRLAADRRLLLGGASAAVHHNTDLIALDQAEAYVREDDFSALTHEYVLEPPVAGVPANVILRVPAVAWPFREKAMFASAPVVAFDLIDAGDFRSVRAGRALLAAR